jgi:hypothetical protein
VKGCSFCPHLSASDTAWENHRRSHPKPRRDYVGPLAPYLVHASTFGVEGVFEAALTDAKHLSSDPLKRGKMLATRMSRPSWNL